MKLNVNLTGRPDFSWGITGHNCGYQAYPAEFLEDQIRLAAELGVDIYRMNITPSKEDEFAYLDKAAELCGRYGLKLFLIIFDGVLFKEDRYGTDYSAQYGPVQPPAHYYERAKLIAARYRGRIPMIQISNEQDISALDLVRYKDPDGDDPKYFDPVKYAQIRDRMAAMLRGVKEAAPEMKTVINFSWKHYGILDMFLADGLEWDETAIDWYSDCDLHADVRPVLEHIFQMPQQAVYVAEGNHQGGDYLVGETEQAEYLLDAMNRFYHMDNPKMKGYMIYELLDEPAHEGGEAHYGLVKNDIRGHIGRPKLAYCAIQRALAGKPPDRDQQTAWELYHKLNEGKTVTGITVRGD